MTAHCQEHARRVSRDARHCSLSRRLHRCTTHCFGMMDESSGGFDGCHKRCYYETLEVERTRDDAELKAAFRKLAMK